MNLNFRSIALREKLFKTLFTKVFPLGILWVLAPIMGFAQMRDYSSYQQMTNRLMWLATQNPRLCSVTSIGKTATDKEIWLITLGRENAANKPAIVLAAGVEATQLATVELALQMAEQLLASAETDDSVRHLLQTKTFYIFPNVNPDATEQYVEQLRWERSGNAQPTDDDRDGRMFEDPYDDLNQDGLITKMRVQHPNGNYRISELDSRLMVKVDTTKGAKGTHLVYSEGLDNDQDGFYNEDGEGGVNFNKNFSFDFPHFQVGSGEHPMSERETKAFADFMFDARNVYAVFVLGPANTLTEPFKSSIQAKVPTEIFAKDNAIYRQVGELYKSLIPTAGIPTTGPTAGDVVQWAYFHYGRYSFSTPGWWIPHMPDPTDLANSNTTPSPEEREGLNFFRWIESQDIAGTFVPWQKIAHPDFPNQETEVGGFAPYVWQTPPLRLLKPVAQNHLQFFRTFATLMPQLEIAEIKTERVTGGLHRVTVEIKNTGGLPTHAALGEQTRWVQKAKISLSLNENQTLVNGGRVFVLEAIAGGEKVNVSWLVKGKGYVGLHLTSPTAGSQSKEIVLR